MPVTHGVTGSSPVHTAIKKRNFSEFLFFAFYSFFLYNTISDRSMLGALSLGISVCSSKVSSFWVSSLMFVYWMRRGDISRYSKLFICIVLHYFISKALSWSHLLPLFSVT